MGDRLSEVPQCGSHVPPQKSSCQSTEGSNKAQSSQTETRQDTNALAGKLASYMYCSVKGLSSSIIDLH